MKKEHLEHIIRAAAAVTNEKVILILGSQSILGTVDIDSEILFRSMEADVFPLKAPQKVDLINGAIGEITPFQEAFGYYAHGIPPETCPLPYNWEKRLQSIKGPNTSGALGLCLGVDDLACSKLAAGREKDIEFVQEMLVHKIVKPDAVWKLIGSLPKEEHQNSALKSLQIICAKLRIEMPSQPLNVGVEKKSPKKSFEGPSH